MVRLQFTRVGGPIYSASPELAKRRRNSRGHRPEDKIVAVILSEAKDLRFRS
jgi:hypothetical protein